jgi:hypothetical protein
MEQSLCQKCGQQIGDGAPVCLRCDAGAGAIPENAGVAALIEMEYDSGIERLTDPTPVRLSVSSGGVQVTEVMPGTRSVWIQADQIIEARVSGSLTSVGKEPRRRWPIIDAFRDNKKSGDGGTRKYTLTISYREGDAVIEAIFHREEPSTLSRVNHIARMISDFAKGD